MKEFETIINRASTEVSADNLMKKPSKLEGDLAMFDDNGFPLNGEYIHAITNGGELIITSSITGLVDMLNELPPETIIDSMGVIEIIDGKLPESFMVDRWTKEQFIDIWAESFGWSKNR